MTGLCEGGNEPAGSLKAIYRAYLLGFRTKPIREVPESETEVTGGQEGRRKARRTGNMCPGVELTDEGMYGLCLRVVSKMTPSQVPKEMIWYMKDLGLQALRFSSTRLRLGPGLKQDGPPGIRINVCGFYDEPTPELSSGTAGKRACRLSYAGCSNLRYRTLIQLEFRNMKIKSPHPYIRFELWMLEKEPKPAWPGDLDPKAQA
ncbi:hypothetical protein ANN_11421 [Periplaneta americana]|uniref:Uncharacterized protein n=1 Tax=Periplaneta americana TaxID=6978 RepID=A0ABQ8T4Z1_PERAM|nr:hypothetical protein ANN_11421 [Periplaneta americana]